MNTSENHAALRAIQEFFSNMENKISQNTYHHFLLCILRYCAEQLAKQSGIICPASLLDDLIDSRSYSHFCASYPSLQKILCTYYEEEDTLGYFYLSLSDLKERKRSGSYYTPFSISKKLISSHLSDTALGKTWLDPACGTGSFLLQLPKNIPLDSIYGNDINPVCIAIARINLAMKYKVTTKEDLMTLYRNFTVSDFLNLPYRFSYDIILGNPPWGAALTASQKKLYQNSFSCVGQSIEIFDLFIEQALDLLSADGILAYILPESVLTVKGHARVRKLIRDTTTALSIEYLGDAFDQVYCPSILLVLKKTTKKTFYDHTLVIKSSQMYRILISRNDENDTFSFSLTDKEYLLLQKLKKIQNCTFLKDNADFALGIVTGNNDAFLLNDKHPDTEPFIRGCDIERYHIRSVSGYLKFSPTQFQQTAPERFYRAKEKLVYRFINRKLIFAYDTSGLLSLNSCNVLIPHLSGLSIKYILAILNSSVAQYIFEKQFSSVKVLRSQLELIPIPIVDQATQEDLLPMVDLLLTHPSDSEQYMSVYQKLDEKIAKLFGLTREEYLWLKNHIY